VENLFAGVRKDFGSVDGPINNASTNRDALLVKVEEGKVQYKMSLEDFNKVIAVDLVGVFLCAREAAVHMIEGGCGGVIINISSISRAGNIGQTNYAAAKAGVAAMTVTWTKELHVQNSGCRHRVGILRYRNGGQPKAGHTRQNHLEYSTEAAGPLKRSGARPSSFCRMITTTVASSR
jgi:NAD(P)-dependent dehydrogenase (short-subunit alcohol dehydrogenase family)